MSFNSQTYKQLLQKNEYRFKMFSLIEEYKEENKKDISNRLRNLLKDQDREMTFTFCRVYAQVVKNNQINVDKYSDLVLDTFGSHASPTLPAAYQGVCQQLHQYAEFSRPMCRIIGLLINKGFYSDDAAHNIFVHLIRYFIVENITFFNLLNSITFIITCFDELKRLNSDAVNWAKHLISTVLQYFSSPQSKSCNTEFQLFIKGTKRPQIMYQILRDDDVKKIATADINQEFLPSIYDTSDLMNFCPSLLSAAIFFGANKCAELIVGKKPDFNQRDLKNRSVFHFAGFIGNISLVPKMSPTKANIRELTRAAIQSCRNFVFDKYKWSENYEDGQTAMHIAAIYNNHKLVAKMIKDGCKVTVKDEGDDLPIHAAARYDSVEVIIRLASSPEFDVNALNLAEKTAFQLSVSNVSPDVFLLLIHDFKVSIQDEKDNSSLPKYNSKPYFTRLYKKYIWNYIIEEEEEEDFVDDSDDF